MSRGVVEVVPSDEAEGVIPFQKRNIGKDVIMIRQVCLLALAAGMFAGMTPQRHAIASDPDYDHVARHAYYDGYGPVTYGPYGSSFGSRYGRGGANYSAYGTGPYGYGGGSDYLFPSVYRERLHYNQDRSVYNPSRYGFYGTDNNDW